jgi:hypothetical protein
LRVRLGASWSGEGERVTHADDDSEVGASGPRESSADRGGGCEKVLDAGGEERGNVACVSIEFTTSASIRLPCT